MLNMVGVQKIILIASSSSSSSPSNSLYDVLPQAQRDLIHSCIAWHYNLPIVYYSFCSLPRIVVREFGKFANT